MQDMAAAQFRLQSAKVAGVQDIAAAQLRLQSAKVADVQDGSGW